MSSQQPAVATPELAVASGESRGQLSDVLGTVKWFDPRKGFGFIVGPDGQDIFVHYSVIEQVTGFRTLKDGEDVLYSAHEGAKGWTASAVRAVRPATGGSPAPTSAPRPTSKPDQNKTGAARSGQRPGPPARRSDT